MPAPGPAPRLMEIFHGALELASAEERAAYLDRVCGPDRALRGRLEGLLAAHFEGDSFLESPAPAPTGTVTTGGRIGPEGPGTIVGPYTLREQIGEGGFGVVYVAEQRAPVKRMAALKVIKAGMDSRQVLARFEAERQALALMDHPNIARVLDAGATESGRPYFVMELVKGVPITRFCDEKRLTPRERLELFIPVCQAVQHAHQKGIIHRDLKPSNVLVGLYDGKPMPKIIDFGVAKATGQKLTEATLFTGFGAVVGTPEYMSPEQAQLDNLDVDTRSDVYALGVLLYELLTGTTPLDRGRLEQTAILQILRLIREAEPPKPSTRLGASAELPTIAACRGVEPRNLCRLVDGGLDWIVMKALEKDRNRRYETANGLAADLQRYLSDEPVQACPPSAWYRFRKMARRNRRALATAALLGAMSLVAVGAIAGAIGWAVRDRGARQAAIEQEALSALREAERLQGQAKFPEALSAAKRADSLLAGGSREPLHERVREVLNDLEMARRLEDIRMLAVAPETPKAGAGQPIDAADTDVKSAEAFREYGIDIATLLPEEAAGRLANRTIRQQLVDALDYWAFCRAVRRRKGDVGQLIAVARAADPKNWRNHLRELYAQPKADWEKILDRVPATVKDRSLSATTLDLCGSILCGVGKPEQALEVFQEAQRRYPGDFWVNYHLGWCHSKLCAVRSRGSPVGAIPTRQLGRSSR